MLTGIAEAQPTPSNQIKRHMLQFPLSINGVEASPYDTVGINFGAGFSCSPSHLGPLNCSVAAGTGNPSGLNGDVQYMQDGSFASDDGIFTYDPDTGTLHIPYLALAESNAPTAALGYGQLWVSSSDGCLYFTTSSSTLYTVACAPTATPTPGATSTPTPTPTMSLFTVGHTWALSGDIAVASGDTNYIVPFFVQLKPGEVAYLDSLTTRINSGTSVAVKITVNGVDATGFNTAVTTTTAVLDPADIQLFDGDEIALVVTDIDGVPKNMTVTTNLSYGY